jgi:TRAP-type mannitol/chloroaromatic compound transport system permease small subunit
MKLRGFVEFVDRFSKRTGEIIAPAALIFMVMLLIEIVARYILNSPTKWAHEISAMFFGAQFMLGGAYCLWSGGMVNVEILHNRLSIRAQAALDLFLIAIPIFFCVILIWRGGAFAWDSIRELEYSQSLLRPPLYPLRAVIPISAFLLLMQIMAKFVRDLYLALTGEKL